MTLSSERASRYSGMNTEISGENREFTFGLRVIFRNDEIRQESGESVPGCTGLVRTSHQRLGIFTGLISRPIK